MRAFVCTDTHLGSIRRSGVTPMSALKLQDRTFNNFRNLLMDHLDLPIIHAGDLFDSMHVPNSEILRAYKAISGWLESSGQKFYCLRANHDWHPSGGKLSSWELLIDILVAQFGDQVVPIYDKLTHIADNVYGLGHVGNSDLFDLELSRAMELKNSVLFFHANFANPFTNGSEHTLNIDKEWAEEFVARGNYLYGGHEHQASSHLGGRVRMLGNNDATSIADCLGNDKKYAYTLEDNGTLTPEVTMDVSAEFINIPWTELSLEIDRPFVRVSGNVNIEQAGDVVDLIAKFRSKSKALVVTNAVSIKDTFEIEDFEDINLASLKSFDVLQELLELLTHPERKVVRELMEIQDERL